MIRCTIELLPGGDEGRARTVGLVEIALTAVSEGNLGEYTVVLKKSPPFKGALRLAWRRGRMVFDNVLVSSVEGEDEDLIVAHIGGHHRTRRGAYDLLYRALQGCGLGARNP